MNLLWLNYSGYAQARGAEPTFPRAEAAPAAPAATAQLTYWENVASKHETLSSLTPGWLH
jgi:hypothetical protein